MPISARLVAFLILGIAPYNAIAQEASSPAPAPAPAAAPVYLPSVADLMTSAVQARHAKLGAAVAERNWTYAAYEVRELRNAFTRIARTSPVYEGQSMATLLTMITPPIDALEAAIKSGDPVGARDAYTTLTTTCNACHVSVKRDYIVIREPASPMFPNQEFRPTPTRR